MQVIFIITIVAKFLAGCFFIAAAVNLYKANKNMQKVEQGLEEIKRILGGPRATRE